MYVEGEISMGKAVEVAGITNRKVIGMNEFVFEDLYDEELK